MKPLPRRALLAAALAPGAAFTAAARDQTLTQGPTANPALRAAMQRARELRDEAVRQGDQAFGAVVLCGDRIVGLGPSRVVVNNDPTAHAEIEALRDAARTLKQRDLSGCLLVSTSRPCRMCEAAAGWARISRMIHSESLSDAGTPS